MRFKSLERKSEKILELETRRNIYEITRKNAGCHFRELERKSKIPHGTLKYHLGFLVKRGLLIVRKDKKYVRYFPREVPFKDSELLSLLRQKHIRRILLFLLSHEECTHGEIVDFIGLSPATVSWYFERLVAENAVRRIRSGRRVRYSLVYDREEIIRLLIVFKESFFDSLVDKTIEMWEIQ